MATATEPTGREVGVVEATDAPDVVPQPKRATPARTTTAAGSALELRREVAGLIKPVAPANEVLQAQNETRALITEALQEGRDYGTIPGTDKPTMLKPGAERVLAAFGCAAVVEVVEQEVDHDREVRWTKSKWMTMNERPADWEELKAAGVGRNRQFDGEWKWQEKHDEHGTSIGLYRYVVRVDVVHRASGVVIGSGVGSCSTLESKYIDRPRDSENTALKMAKKRALIDAVLTTFGLSDQFTQDVEDDPDRYRRDDSSGGSADPQEPKPECPECSGPMWDNRKNKRNPRAPDFKCKKKDCKGAFWPGDWPPQDDTDRATDDEIAALRQLRTEVAELGGNPTRIDKLLTTADTGALAGTAAQNAIADARAWIGAKREQTAGSTS